MTALPENVHHRLAEIVGNDHYNFAQYEDFRSRRRRLQRILAALDPAVLAPDLLLCEAAEVLIDHCKVPDLVRAGWARYACQTRDQLDDPDEYLTITLWWQAADVFRDAGLIHDALHAAQIALDRFQRNGHDVMVPDARNTVARAAQLAGDCERGLRLAREVTSDPAWRPVYHVDQVKAYLTLLIGCGHDAQATPVLDEYLARPYPRRALTAIGTYLARFCTNHAAVCTNPGPASRTPLMQRLAAPPWASTIYRPPPADTPMGSAVSISGGVGRKP